jgi:hypothetical protein
VVACRPSIWCTTHANATLPWLTFFKLYKIVWKRIAPSNTSFSFIRHQLFFSDWVHFKNYISYVCRKHSKIYCNFSFPYDWYWFDGINYKTSCLNRVLSKVNKIWFYKKTMKSLSYKFYFKLQRRFKMTQFKLRMSMLTNSTRKLILFKLLYLNKILVFTI